MDGQYVSMEVHKEFEKRMISENERLGDEDKRQNKRIDALEDAVRQIGTLAASTEKLAVNMENMLKIQEQQGRRLETLEAQDEINSLAASVERMAAAVENARAIQEQQGQKLEVLESRDGEMWRRVTGYIITAVVGIVIGFIFKQIGM